MKKVANCFFYQEPFPQPIERTVSIVYVQQYALFVYIVIDYIIGYFTKT
jgi:hypothetical protein